MDASTANHCLAYDVYDHGAGVETLSTLSTVLTAQQKLADEIESGNTRGMAEGSLEIFGTHLANR